MMMEMRRAGAPEMKAALLEAVEVETGGTLVATDLSRRLRGVLDEKGGRG